MPGATLVASTDGVDLAAYDLGGSGRDALLVHANGFCAAVWAPLATALAPWHCVAFDARAHGRSTPPATDMAWEGHRDDVLAVVDALGLVGTVGIGHSMGGAALLLAEQLRPGTFSSLWLFEPIVFPPHSVDPTGNPLAEGARRRRDRFDSEATAFANFANKAPLDELSPECLAAYVHHGFELQPDGSVTLRCRPGDEAAGYDMGVRHGAWEHLGEVRCPVTVARGADFGMGPAAVAPQIVDRLARGTLEEHPELGHFGPLADPARVARSIVAHDTAPPR